MKHEGNHTFNLQASERYTITETEAVIIDSFHDKKIHVDGYIGILHINEVTLEDLGKYTVQIQNGFGIELFTFFLDDIPEARGMFVFISYLSHTFDCRDTSFYSLYKNDNMIHLINITNQRLL